MLVQVDGLTKEYGQVTALRDCSFQVREGEVFGLLGPNGAGKTTLLRLLMGFLRPTSGQATIDGLDVYRDSVAVHQRVAYLPGDVRLFRRMRAGRLLRFLCDMRPEGDLQRGLDIAARLDLDLGRKVAFMSTGMRQKLALAATLAAATPLIILDEPTSNLDPNVRSQVAALVREARDAGRTVIFSSHVLPEVEEVCHRVVILRKGQLVHTQVLSELRRCHRIFARQTGPMPDVPDHLGDSIELRCTAEGKIVITIAGDLAPALGWLSGAPLHDMHVEPMGLRAVYDAYHGAHDSASVGAEPPLAEDCCGSPSQEVIRG